MLEEENDSETEIYSSFNLPRIEEKSINGSPEKLVNSYCVPCFTFVLLKEREIAV